MEADAVFQFGRPPNRIDLLSAVDGVSFSTAWPSRVREKLEDGKGGSFPLDVIGLFDLLENKRAAGRHKDLDDVEHLTPRSPR